MSAQDEAIKKRRDEVLSIRWCFHQEEPRVTACPICGGITEDLSLWDPWDDIGGVMMSYPWFRGYYEAEVGDFWLVDLDGTRRSNLFFTREKYDRAVRYILTGSEEEIV